MRQETGKQTGVRQQIVETAERLFYAERVRAVVSDRTIAEADRRA